MIAGNASAATDDSFSVNTRLNDGCSGGAVVFIDYGPGAPGGGDNDDYIKVIDDCSNGDGVKAWVWIDGGLLGSKYNGNGAGTTIVWDPFENGNVKPRQLIGLKICDVNGNNGTPRNCGDAEWRSRDG